MDDFLQTFSESLPEGIDLDDLKRSYPSPLWEQMPEMAAISALAKGILDTADYLERYPDVKVAGIDPVRHFVKFGIYEQRSIKIRSEFSSGLDTIDYIVSLTSYPARIEKCHAAIESILTQNVKHKRVVLWLATNEFPDFEQSLPENLLKLRSKEFHIEWCENLYSYKKLIPALEKYPEKVIITADDDIIYPQGWLRALLEAYIDEPGAIHAHRCRVMEVNEAGIPQNYNKWKINQRADSSRLFPIGCGGILYPPKALHADACARDIFMKICQYGDDIWFWAMTRLNHTPIRRLESAIDWEFLQYVEGTQQQCLWKENANGRNAKMFDAVFRRYPELASDLAADARISEIDIHKFVGGVEKPSVSVIIPVYNTSVYLKKCLENIVSQKKITQEIFIIDDGSTDESAEIIDSFQKRDNRIMVISKANEGQGRARNMALELATGEFVYFMDSDDYIAEDTLEILYEAANRHHLDIVSPKIPRHYFEKNLDFVSCIPNKAQFVRREIIEKYNIRQPLSRSGQDGVFAHLCLTHCERIGMANNARHFYTTRETGTSSIYAAAKHEEVLSLLQSHYGHITEHYDKYSLWNTQSLRLLLFMLEESIRNRIEKHILFMSLESSAKCFALLRNIGERCVEHLDGSQSAFIPEVVRTIIATDPIEMSGIYLQNFHGKTPALTLPANENFLAKDNVYICKLSKEALSRKDKNKPCANVGLAKTDPNKGMSLEKKLDYLINHITNTSSDILVEMRQPAPTLETGEKSLVVSLTSLPQRLHSVYLAIESIFNQFLQPSQVILWLPNTIHRASIPARLNSLVSRGLEIKYIRDVGPHSKLLYALKNMPDKNIVTIDDDIVYPRNMLSTMFDFHLKYPNAIIANWARELAFDEEGRVLPIREGKLLVNFKEDDLEPNIKYQPEPSLLAFPYGTSGVLYPPNSLHGEVFNVPRFKRLCPKEDDIWFKAMSLLSNIPVVVTDLGIKAVHRVIVGSQTEALRYYNHGEQQNIRQLRAVFEEFDLYSHLPKKQK